MKTRRYDEFSLHIRWRAQRGWRPVDVPGFYLTIGWANEGEASWIAEDCPLSFDQLESIYAIINKVADLDESCAVSNMRTQYKIDQQERIARLQQHKQRIDRQLAALLESERNSLDN